jgi:hypothetical protein
VCVYKLSGLNTCPLPPLPPLSLPRTPTQPAVPLWRPACCTARETAAATTAPSGAPSTASTHPPPMHTGMWYMCICVCVICGIYCQLLPLLPLFPPSYLCARHDHLLLLQPLAEATTTGRRRAGACVCRGRVSVCVCVCLCMCVQVIRVG